ncbi:MAG: ATP-binding cassette domain-containing protein [Hahellaceae bacterium]|nr:ATP-binding cassette domain-containing protein [Hahellaceae bacterium]MCP5209762.1 ATP-binding cassette domain-containing protein [Hahellaceae bacterium]
MSQCQSNHEPSDLKVINLSAGVVAGANLTVRQGEVLVLMGPSGCGKSCLLKGIADLIPNTGEVWLSGHEKNHLPPSQWRKQVQLVPAESRWWFPSALPHFAQPPDDAVWEKVGLSKADGSKPIGYLSTGQRQRLVLLRALQNQPKVLLLDEPTASLDDETTLRVESFLQEYIARNAIPTLWVTHNMAQAERVGSALLRFPEMVTSRLPRACGAEPESRE